jgi:hypothetical protein
LEKDEPALADLSRLVFTFNRRDHGRLRMLIDFLNDLPGENGEANGRLPTRYGK